MEEKNQINSIDDLITKIEISEVDWKNVQEIKISEHVHPKLSEFAKLKDINQGALKVNINSEFGALDNEYFVVNNRNISGSITFMGRILNRLTGNNIKNHLSKKYNIGGDKILVYADTDSLISSTKLRVDNLYKVTFDNGDIKYVDDDELQIIKNKQKLSENSKDKIH